MAMLFPTYGDIIKKVNSTSEDGKPIIESRYSVVAAAAKRARQIVENEEETVYSGYDKPLTVAINELDSGEVTILPKEE